MIHSSPTLALIETFHWNRRSLMRAAFSSLTIVLGTLVRPVLFELTQCGPDPIVISRQQPTGPCFQRCSVKYTQSQPIIVPEPIRQLAENRRMVSGARNSAALSRILRPP